MPPLLHNERGELRKVGFELEFAEIELAEVANSIIKLYGGETLIKNKFLQQVNNTRYGNFTLEIDAGMLTEKKYQGFLDFFEESTQHGLEDMLGTLASFVVPSEVGTPPVPLSEIENLDLLRNELLVHKAKGTKTSLLRAFGTHINAELPKLTISCILDYLRAFLLLYPWLLEHSKIDISRRVTSFINPFPEEYTRLVLDEAYNRDLPTFLADYYKYNPDRNRPLDLYPVLAFLDKEAVFKLQGLGPVKDRPTFHYRLPNSLIDDPSWTLASEWNCWVLVEELASDREKIKAMSREYLDLEKNSLLGFKTRWISRVKEWI